MNEDQLEKFIKKAKDIKLSAGERSAIKQSVLNFISKNPISRVSASHNFWSGVNYSKFNFAPVMALLFIAIFVGGGISFGAEKALPGDILYPVKLEVNEKIRGWASISEESKADWEVARAERRLSEAEQLVTNGSLDVKARENIEANFEAHAEEVQKKIEKFEQKEDFKAAAEVSAKFEVSLKSHQKTLKRLSTEKNDGNNKEVRPIRIKIKSQTDSLKESIKRIELKSNGGASGDTRMTMEAIRPKNDARDEDEDDLEEYLKDGSDNKSGETRGGENLKLDLHLQK